jgi:hypothetical protein
MGDSGRQSWWQHRRRPHEMQVHVPAEYDQLWVTKRRPEMVQLIRHEVRPTPMAMRRERGPRGCGCLRTLSH